MTRNADQRRNRQGHLNLASREGKRLKNMDSLYAKYHLGP